MSDVASQGKEYFFVTVGGGGGDGPIFLNNRKVSCIVYANFDTSARPIDFEDTAGNRLFEMNADVDVTSVLAFAHPITVVSGLTINWGSANGNQQVTIVTTRSG